MTPVSGPTPWRSSFVHDVVIAHESRVSLRPGPPEESQWPVRIEDYALIGDTQTAALVGQRRVDRLAVRPPLRLGRRVRGAAGHPRPRSLADRARRRGPARSSASTTATRWCSRPRSTPTTASCAIIDCMPIRAAGRRARAHRRRRLGPGPDAHGSAHPLRLRLDRPVGPPSDDGRLRAIAGPDALVLTTPVLHRGRGPAHRRRLRRRSRRAGAVRPGVVPVARAPAPRAATRSALRTRRRGGGTGGRGVARTRPRPATSSCARSSR